jgi:hypothetical protein
LGGFCKNKKCETDFELLITSLRGNIWYCLDPITKSLVTGLEIVVKLFQELNRKKIAKR